MMNLINTHAQSLVEKFLQTGVACFLVMTHSAIAGASLAHVITAAKTGIIAAVAWVIISLIPKLSTVHWGIWLTGILAAVADWWVHPSAIGVWWTEPVVTGLLAMVLMLGYEQIMHKRNS